MSDKPEIATELDKYIQEQIDNGNYEMINVEEARKKHQLHFVGYNFCSVLHQLLNQSENDYGQLYAHQNWSQPQQGHPTCPFGRPQPPWNLNSLKMPPSLLLCPAEFRRNFSRNSVRMEFRSAEFRLLICYKS